MGMRSNLEDAKKSWIRYMCAIKMQNVADSFTQRANFVRLKETLKDQLAVVLDELTEEEYKAYSAFTAEKRQWFEAI